MTASISPRKRYNLREWSRPVPFSGAKPRASNPVHIPVWVEVERVPVNQHVYVVIDRDDAHVASLHRVCTFTAAGLCCVFEQHGLSLENARKTALKQCMNFTCAKSR